MPSEPTQRLAEARERLWETTGVPGLQLTASLAEATDRCVADLWAAASPPEGAALIAVGGYGGGHLFPRSDVDLAVIHRRRAEVGPPVKFLSYSLWDMGLEAAVTVHTSREAMRLAHGRLDVLTSLLQARLLAGEEALHVQLMEALSRETSKDLPALSKAFSDEVAHRRSGAADLTAELEPDLKLGRGGLRDLSALRLLLSIGTWSGALPNADDIHSARWALHLVTGRRTDILAMPLQKAVATRIDAGDDEDVLMVRLYTVARAVAYSLDTALDPPSDEEPGEIIEILERGRAGERSWRALDVDGRLVAQLPEWDRIRCLPQRNLYHRFAVDIHSYEVAVALADAEDSSDEVVRKAAEESRSDRRLLLVAGLLHDIGKGAEGDHSEVGAVLAAQAARRLGLGEDDVAEVVWLVANHLLLSETATRRDIADERLIVELAERMGSERRARLLFLLTVADSQATGPSGWNPWKRTLVTRLFARIVHMLERGELVGGAASTKAHGLEDRLRKSHGSHPALEAHLAGMPREWLLDQPEEALVRQTEMMLSPPAEGAVDLRATPVEGAGIWEVMVVARDRPGLFSKVSGALALHGVNVVGAQVYTRSDGVALEVFRVETLGDEELRFERVASDIAKALRGRLAMDAHIAEKRRQYSRGGPAGGRPRVVVDNSASDFSTIIEVHASDRVGLLYDLTRALSELDLDIRLAKVATYGHEVVDVFYVRDLFGQKITDADHIAEVTRTIEHRFAV